MKPRAALSWSGGKDSYLALHRSVSRFDVVAAVTMFNEDASRSRSHGLRPDVVDAQVSRLGLTHVRGRGSWASYEDGFRAALRHVRSFGITHVIFGDIMYDSNREFPERVCAAERLVAVEPLWGEPTESLYCEFIATGADARIVTVRDDVISPAWLGRALTLELLPEFAALGVDPCGEHGEYHTVVVSAPLFSSELRLIAGERVCRTGCWALDLSLDESLPAESVGDAAGV
jgi:uncharacterized protein (TIGR00290 family)